MGGDSEGRERQDGHNEPVPGPAPATMANSLVDDILVWLDSVRYLVTLLV